ncbi:MAG: GDSL-type esterase/lipase family protein, partial [Clostridiales bacterium]|nr:GDSL-type esterase/lipase family protein [Clostridiales bacterium]
FPYCYPNPFYDGNKSNKMAKEIDNEESYAEEMKKTVEIKDLDVKDKTKAKITVSYYLYNYTGKELSPKSCVAFYKYSADTDKFLFKKEIGKSIPKISMDEEGNPIPVKIEHTITSSSTYSGNYPLVLRFFDNGAKFPYTYPNAFFDINPDGKTLCESGETDTGKTVSISDISVVKNGISKVTVTYKVTNTTDKALDKSSRVAFYENKPVSANLLKKSTLGKSVPNDGIPVEISQILENTNVSKMRIVARLFDNAETFPYFCPNILLDFNLKNKDAKASAFEKKIICVGDSNTYGYNVTPKKKYPYQLQEKLNVPGYDYAVVNYGVSSRTANSLGNLPYTGTSAYKKAIASEPDIVIINLGPNDTKDVNWITSIRSKFKKNYKALIREFQNLEIAPGIHPKIYIATPVRVLKTSSRGISEVRTEELRKEIIKIAEELQEENEAMDGVFELTLLRPELIFDTFDPATLKKCYQSDNLHLTSFGCEKLSAYYYDILTSD